MIRIRYGAAGLLLLGAACGGGESGGTGGGTGGPGGRVLTPEGVNHIQAKYSPDGSHVAFWTPGADGWDVVIARADLSGARVVAERNVQTFELIWSPDSRQVAIASSAANAADILIAPADSGPVRQVTSAPGFEIPNAWSPRGDRLSYAASGEGGVVRGALLDPASGASSPLPAAATPVARWSPDGSKLSLEAVGGNAGIWVADSTGGNAKQLTTEGLESDARWSPDGTELAYVSRRTGTGDIWVVPAAGGTPRQLTRDIREDNSPRWSPDGKWIGFLSQRCRQTDVWVVPAAGGQEIRVTDDAAEEGNLQWVGKSMTLAYHTGITGQGLWVTTISEGNERRLTPDTIRVGQIFPSPDGKEVVYEVLRGGGVSDLQVMPMAGGAPRTLVAGSSINTAGNWSPDGKSIAYLSNRAGNFDVWIVAASGGEPRQLTNWPTNEVNGQWAPDGSALYFTSNHDAAPFSDVWKVAAAGGEPTRVTKAGNITALAVSLVSNDVFVLQAGGKGGRTVLAKVLPGEKLQALWDKSNVFNFSWLGFLPPKGDSLAINAELPGGGVGSYLVSTKTGQGRQILGKSDLAGDFSPDGRWLAYQKGTAALKMSVLDMKDGSTRTLNRTLNRSPEREPTYWWTADNNTIVFGRQSQRRRIATVDLTKLLARGK